MVESLERELAELKEAEKIKEMELKELQQQIKRIEEEIKSKLKLIDCTKQNSKSSIKWLSARSYTSNVNESHKKSVKERKYVNAEKPKRSKSCYECYQWYHNIDHKGIYKDWQEHEAKTCRHRHEREFTPPSLWDISFPQD